MLYFSRFPISAKILRLPEMFTSTVHNISHRPYIGTSQTYPKISALPSEQCPLIRTFLCIKRGFYNYGFHPQNNLSTPNCSKVTTLSFRLESFKRLNLVESDFLFFHLLNGVTLRHSPLSGLLIAISISSICLSIIAICLSVESGIFSN